MAASPISLASMFLANTQATKNTTATQKAQATGSTTSSTSAGTGLGSTTTGTTFLNLLVKELQNQDPTAPMDSTAMVGQMISLNSLDQLISINQTLSTATKSTSAQAVGNVANGASTSGSAAQVAARNALLNSTQNTNAIQNAAQTALDPNKALDLSSLNIPYGGKY